jgi:hypothetical protein
MARILDLDREELSALHGRSLTEAVALAEGRTIVSEVISGAPPLADGIHNMEIEAAMGADLIILNFVEMVIGADGWTFPGLGKVPDLRALARRVGRPIGVNLEPGDVPAPRRATLDAARRLITDGAAMLCITANPKTDTTYADMIRVTKELRAGLGPDVAIWAGKMHQAGRAEAIGPEPIVRLIRAGADGVLLPLPGTVPGVTRELGAQVCAAAHAEGAIVMGTIGTSQEGSRPSIAQPLALLAKEIGVDAHHIGDAGLSHTADPDLLYEYSIAVRGRRHTWRRMALGNRHI